MRDNISRWFLFLLSFSIYYLQFVFSSTHISRKTGLFVFHAKRLTNMWAGTLFDLCHFARVINNILYFYYYILLYEYMRLACCRTFCTLNTEEHRTTMNNCIYRRIWLNNIELFLFMCVCTTIKQTFSKKIDSNGKKAGEMCDFIVVAWV